MKKYRKNYRNNSYPARRVIPLVRRLRAEVNNLRTMVSTSHKKHFTELLLARQALEEMRAIALALQTPLDDRTPQQQGWLSRPPRGRTKLTAPILVRAWQLHHQEGMAAARIAQVIGTTENLVSAFLARDYPSAEAVAAYKQLGVVPRAVERGFWPKES